MSDPRDISYPPKPDARGSAKRYHNRRAYYFGRHNSPDSYTLFAAWKERLVETGEAPNVQDIREQLARRKELESLERETVSHAEKLSIQDRSAAMSWLSGVPAILLALAASIALCCGAFFGSRVRSRAVDDISLSLEEVERIRGLRLYEEMRVEQIQSKPNRAEKLAKLTEKLIRLGPADGKLHREKDSS